MNEEKKMTATKDKRLDNTLEAISKDLGFTIARIGEQKIEPLPRLNTGSLSLDIATGGGWVFGRIHEIFGPEGTGKTLLSLFAIAEAQKKGINCAFIDMEQALDLTWAEKHGVNVSDLVHTQPDSAEKALNAMERLTSTGKFGVIVIDSVSALLPQAEIDGEIGDQLPGLQARLLGAALRKISPVAASTGTVIIFINQIRMKIGVMWGSPETTSGGQGLKFYSSIRLDVRKVSKSEVFDANKNQIGHDQRVKVIKNKTAPPFREAAVPILYTSGIRLVDDTMNAAQSLNLLDFSNPLEIGGKSFGTLASLKDSLASDSVFLELVRKEISDKIKV